MPLESDDLVEGAETVNLALESATSSGSVAATIGPNSTATISIANVPDSKAPLLDVAAANKLKLRGKRPSISMRVFCDEACTVAADGAVALKKGKNSRGTGRAKPVDLPDVSASLQPVSFQSLTIKLSKRAAKKIRKALRMGGRATANLTIVATDSAGNATTTERRIRLS